MTNHFGLILLGSLFCSSANADLFDIDIIRKLQEAQPIVQNIGEIELNAATAIIANIENADASLAISTLQAGVHLDPRIVGGVPTTIEQNPWQVALIHGGTPDVVRQQFCGGSLISQSVVLTAAHCVDWITGPAAVEVIAGTSYYRHGGERIKVNQLVVHPEWNSATQSNDLAILVLERSSALGASIETANDPAAVFANETLIVSGWGALSQGGIGSDILMHAAVPPVNLEECNKPESYNGAVDQTMFCAGLRDGGVDSCQGDSGGPIYGVVNGKPMLFGVVSWGAGCAQRLKYGVYSNLAQSKEWILGHLSKP
ncbi:serine protease [Rhodobacter sp. SY28-1]|uniref:S1 family serine peptidase n=1 Tax=Rhodobacter sp. SY28-1 TaxID=2562317 RepID=UPI001484F4CD|nr:serine protease [Rhodobacter sp. SY28-1]